MSGSDPSRGTLISVIVSEWGSEESFEPTLRSVWEQNDASLELVVIAGDGDGPSQLSRFCHRTNVRQRFERIVFLDERGVSDLPTRLNRGLLECEGDYVSLVEPGDAYVRHRFSSLRKACSQRGAELAFSRVELRPPISSSREFTAISANSLDLNRAQDDVDLLPTVGFALLRNPWVVSGGTLLFTRSLALRVGGFADYQHMYAWDLALRCLLETEPAYVHEPLHTRAGSADRRSGESMARQEAQAALSNYLFRCSTYRLSNPLAPSPAWGPFWGRFIEAAEV